MFGSMSLKTKLLLSYGFCLLCLVVVGIVGIIGLEKVSAGYQHIDKVNLPNTVFAANMRGSQKDVVIAVSTVLGAHVAPELAKEEKLLAEAAIARFQENAKKYEAVPFSAGEEEIWKKTTASWTAFMNTSLKILDLAASGTEADDKLRQEIASKEMPDLRKEILTDLNALIAFHGQETQKWEAKAEAAAKLSQTLAFGVIAVSFILVLAFGWIFSSGLSKNLTAIASQLSGGAGEVAAASKQISDAGSELSASATEQAAALQETVSSIDEVSAMVNKNAENAKKSQSVSATSHQTATRGKVVVGEMIQSIEEINQSNGEIMQQIETSNREISEIVKVIAEIGNKTKVINDIVFQTKLLSFNASVEAARAGEHGKGFAVVAEEVGNLAQMSGNAAKEISQMLEGSIQKVEKIVNDTKSKVERLVVTGREKVEKGTTTAKRCGEVLDEIVTNVSELTQMVSEIATASSEQAQGVEEITKAMGQLDQVTQQNASSSQQSASAAESLTTQAVGLNGLVENLVQMVRGAGAGLAAVAPPTTGPAKATRSKVVNFQEKSLAKKAKTALASKNATGKQSLQMAVGSDIPAENDPRFEEI